ncbi:MAG: preprotein translocase subunit SecE [Oscillospiraceae bacterium]|jgi:preprotein translocase subunit SecE|nr:preprotein translocase subunit SecE [Oscillospiraceae bacterium]
MADKKSVDKSEKTEAAKKPSEKTEAAKKLSEKRARRAAAAKKPKKSVFRYFKDARAEFKKVTWPTPRQTVNNTAAVLSMLVVAGLAIWGLDKAFESLFGLVLLK